jgi:hypothetical protein
MLASIRLPPPYLLLRFERYTISKHHRRSITGLQFPTSGKMPLGSSRISRRKHKHLYRRRFPGFSIFFCFLFLFGRTSKERAASFAAMLLKTWIYGLTAFLKSCFLFLCTELSMDGASSTDDAAVNSG